MHRFITGGLVGLALVLSPITAQAQTQLDDYVPTDFNARVGVVERGERGVAVRLLPLPGVPLPGNTLVILGAGPVGLAAVEGSCYRVSALMAPPAPPPPPPTGPRAIGAALAARMLGVAGITDMTPLPCP